MPMYDLLNTDTNEETEVLMKWSELQTYLSENPNIKLLPAAPAIVSGVAGRMRTDEGFKDVLRTIKRNNRGSTIDVD